MREIKFRAWDKGQERMLPVTEPEEQGKREYFPFEVQIGFSHWNKDDIVLMQYTGLKDKNGKEIYDGDIIEFDLEDFKDYHPVFYKEGSFVCGTFSPDLLSILLIEDPELIVAGNIYENPDLLK